MIFSQFFKTLKSFQSNETCIFILSDFDMKPNSFIKNIMWQNYDDPLVVPMFLQIPICSNQATYRSKVWAMQKMVVKNYPRLCYSIWYTCKMYIKSAKQRNGNNSTHCSYRKNTFLESISFPSMYALIKHHFDPMSFWQQFC